MKKISTLVLFISFFYSIGQHLTEKQKIEFNEKFFDAETYRIKGDFNKSNQLFQEILNIDPKNDAVLFKIAQNFYDSKNLNQAEIFLNQAIKINDQNKWYKYWKIKIAIAQQKNRQEIIKMIKKFQPESHNKYLISAIYEELNTKTYPREKEEKIKKIQKINFKQEIQSLLNQKKYQQSLKIIEKKLEEYPDYAPLYLWASKAYAAMKNWKKSLEYLNLGIDFAIVNKDILKQFYEQYLTVYENLGKLNKVKQYKQKINKI